MNQGLIKTTRADNESSAYKPRHDNQSRADGKPDNEP